MAEESKNQFGVNFSDVEKSIRKQNENDDNGENFDFDKRMASAKVKQGKHVSNNDDENNSSDNVSVSDEDKNVEISVDNNVDENENNDDKETSQDLVDMSEDSDGQTDESQVADGDDNQVSTDGNMSENAVDDEHDGIETVDFEVEPENETEIEEEQQQPKMSKKEIKQAQQRSVSEAAYRGIPAAYFDRLKAMFGVSNRQQALSAYLYVTLYELCDIPPEVSSSDKRLAKAYLEENPNTYPSLIKKIDKLSRHVVKLDRDLQDLKFVKGYELCEMFNLLEPQDLAGDPKNFKVNKDLIYKMNVALETVAQQYRKSIRPSENQRRKNAMKR